MAQQLLKKARRKISGVQRERGEAKLKQTEKERRLSYIRTRRAETLSLQEALQAEQSTKEKRALEKEWEARAARKGASASLRRARVRKVIQPVRKVTQSLRPILAKPIESIARRATRPLKGLKLSLRTRPPGTKRKSLTDKELTRSIFSGSKPSTTPSPRSTRSNIPSIFGSGGFKL